MDKVLNLKTDTLKILKAKNPVIVFTNGCFDLLHPGHIQYLSEAKELGTLLIVGINDDASISRLKGSQRPINNLDFRIRMLSGLSSVDYIIPFSEDTPEKLIQTVSPDILVKGADYEVKDIVGADFVIKNGGAVKRIPFLEGYSTTQLIEKIKAQLNAH